MVATLCFGFDLVFVKITTQKFHPWWYFGDMSTSNLWTSMLCRHFVDWYCLQLMMIILARLTVRTPLPFIPATTVSAHLECHERFCLERFVASVCKKYGSVNPNGKGTIGNIGKMEVPPQTFRQRSKSFFRTFGMQFLQGGTNHSSYCERISHVLVMLLFGISFSHIQIILKHPSRT